MPQTEPLRPRRELEPGDLGSMRNSLGILTRDHKSFRPERLMDITGLGHTELSRMTGKARPLLYKKELPLKLSSNLAKSIIHLVVVTDLAFELFSKKEKDTTLWLMSPNTLLFGDSPFVVAMRGDGEKLITWLNTRLGRVEGAAF